MYIVRKLLVLVFLGWVLAAEDEEHFYDFPELGEYPYVALVESKVAMCAGVILTPEWVLTAAHCVFDSRKKKFIENNAVRIFAAVLEGQDKSSPAMQLTPSKKVLGHPDFDFDHSWGEPSKWDVALIELKDAFTFNEHVNSTKICGKPWPQDTKNKKSLKQDCFAIGFGTYKMPYQSTNKLKRKNVTAQHGEEACPCALRFQWKRMVCVHSKKGEPRHAMMCAGDDGGPLVCGGEVVALTHMVWNSNKCDKAQYPQPKCNNPEPSVDLYFYLCVVNDWLHSVVKSVPPAPVVGCDALRIGRSKPLLLSLLCIFVLQSTVLF